MERHQRAFVNQISRRRGSQGNSAINNSRIQEMSRLVRTVCNQSRNVLEIFGLYLIRIGYTFLGSKKALCTELGFFQVFPKIIQSVYEHFLCIDIVGKQ